MTPEAKPAIAIFPVEPIGEIAPGDDLARTITERTQLERGDIVVVSQKVVSKAEGRLRRLEQVSPSEKALELAAATGRDPALVELILTESRRIVRATAAALIVETRSGLICANAGIDGSNLGAAGGERTVALLPADPDRSAVGLQERLGELTGLRVGVLISDSFGRPWRLGQSEVAIGCAGIDPLDDWRGRPDRDGRTLEATSIAVADEIAAAADLVRDKISGTPVVVVRGLARLALEGSGPGAAALQRPGHEDLFR